MAATILGLVLGPISNIIGKVIEDKAASPNMFVAGWRPAVGWICALALVINLVFGPIGTWATNLFGHPTPFPTLDANLLMSLLFPLLGLGAYRTVEKVTGTAANH
jgi:hypothetical protein